MLARPDGRASAWWEAFRARQFARAKGACCQKHAGERAARGRECERVACQGTPRQARAHALLVLPGVPGNVRRLVVCRRCQREIGGHRFASTGSAP